MASGGTPSSQCPSVVPHIPALPGGRCIEIRSGTLILIRVGGGPPAQHPTRTSSRRAYSGIHTRASRRSRRVIRSHEKLPACSWLSAACENQFSHSCSPALAGLSMRSWRVCSLYPRLISMVNRSMRGVPMASVAAMSPCWPAVLAPRRPRTLARAPLPLLRQNTSSRPPFVHHSENRLHSSRSYSEPLAELLRPRRISATSDGDHPHRSRAAFSSSLTLEAEARSFATFTPLRFAGGGPGYFVPDAPHSQPIC